MVTSIPASYGAARPQSKGAAIPARTAHQCVEREIVACCIIAPRRSHSAHLHRPWRATSVHNAATDSRRFPLFRPSGCISRPMTNKCTVIRNGRPPYAARGLASARRTAVGSFAMTASRMRAVRSGRRRPCSQAWIAVTSRPNARETALRQAQATAELRDVHAIRHCHRVARQLDFTPRMRQRFREGGNKAAAKRATLPLRARRQACGFHAFRHRSGPPFRSWHKHRCRCGFQPKISKTTPCKVAGGRRQGRFGALWGVILDTSGKSTALVHHRTIR